MSTFRTTDSNPITIDGLTGLRLTGIANEFTPTAQLVHETILHDPAGGYYLLLGIAPQSNAATHVSLFDKMAASFRRRCPPKNRLTHALISGASQHRSAARTSQVPFKRNQYPPSPAFRLTHPYARRNVLAAGEALPAFLTPSNATAQWTSSDESIFSIEQRHGKYHLVGHAPGTANVIINGQPLADPIHAIDPAQPQRLFLRLNFGRHQALAIATASWDPPCHRDVTADPALHRNTANAQVLILLADGPARLAVSYLSLQAHVVLDCRRRGRSPPTARNSSLPVSSRPCRSKSTVRATTATSMTASRNRRAQPGSSGTTRAGTSPVSALERKS